MTSTAAPHAAPPGLPPAAAPPAATPPAATQPAAGQPPAAGTDGKWRRASPLRSWRAVAGGTMVAAGAAVVTGCLLPWAEVFAGLIGIPGIRGSNGKLLAAAGVLLAATGLWHLIKGGTASRWVAGIAGAAVLGSAGFLLMRLSATLRALGGDSMMAARGGPGLWVVAGGGLAAFATLFFPQSGQRAMMVRRPGGGLVAWAADRDSTGPRRWVQLRISVRCGWSTPDCRPSPTCSRGDSSPRRSAVPRWATRPRCRTRSWESARSCWRIRPCSMPASPRSSWRSGSAWRGGGRPAPPWLARSSGRSGSGGWPRAWAESWLPPPAPSRARRGRPCSTRSSPSSPGHAAPPSATPPPLPRWPAADQPARRRLLLLPARRSRAGSPAGSGPG